MEKKHIIQVSGNDFVTFEGLLAEAHQQGLKRIHTTLIQLPSEANGMMAVMHATVETEKGEFEGIGDASPANVGRMIVPHIIRMAETRAKARALRDAVNVGVTSFEELGGGDEADSAPAPTAAKAQPRQAPSATQDTYRPASTSQLSAITKLSGLLGKSGDVGDMTEDEAKERIRILSLEYNTAQKSAGRTA